ncbi:hypothetical protein NFI96_020030 [Prochilodus magdalenae]|nr:hypothetical protein NFI96_020030 [Prochilodus magdalenae]
MFRPVLLTAAPATQLDMFCASVLAISMDMGFGPPTHGHLHKPPSPRLRHRACAKKRVVFADSKGLSLTSVRVFSKKEEKPRVETPPSLNPKSLCWLGEREQGPSLHMGFAQPCADLQAFQQRVRQSPVLLESCCVTERALVGTVRVWNLSYEKSVSVRITFDSWQTQQDVPCAFLQRHYGEPDTDTFSFHIALPGALEARERVEFCVKYLPQGHSQALWDNNNGSNYTLYVCD